MASYYYSDAGKFKTLLQNLGEVNKADIIKEAQFSRTSLTNIAKGRRVTSKVANKGFKALVRLNVLEEGDFENYFPKCSNTSLAKQGQKEVVLDTAAQHKKEASKAET